jgi:hypothetical protein
MECARGRQRHRSRRAGGHASQFHWPTARAPRFAEWRIAAAGKACTRDRNRIFASPFRLAEHLSVRGKRDAEDGTFMAPRWDRCRGFCRSKNSERKFKLLILQDISKRKNGAISMGLRTGIWGHGAATRFRPGVRSGSYQSAQNPLVLLICESRRAAVSRPGALAGPGVAAKLPRGAKPNRGSASRPFCRRAQTPFPARAVTAAFAISQSRRLS